MGEISASAGKPDRRVVADAVALAFSHSRLKQLVEPDALDAVLRIDAADLVRDGAVDLQAAWEIVSDLPGFDPEAARAPIAVLKTWEDQFGAPVKLPDAIAELSDRDIGLARAECAPPAHEIRRAFEPPEERAARKAALEEATAASAPAVEETGSDWRHNPKLAIVAGVVLVAALGFAGVSLFRALNTEPDWRKLDPSEFAGDIPAKSAKVFGKHVGITLSDDAWLQKPRVELRESLEYALRRAPIADAATLFLQDSGGEIRATAQWYDMPPKIKVTFR